MIKKEKILEFIKKNAKGKKDIGFDTDLFKEGILDSLEVLSFTIFIESEFGVEITMEDVLANSFKNVNDIFMLIEKKKNAKHGL
jgi:acyl carrier protein